MTTLATDASRFRLSRCDLDAFKSLVLRQRWDWPAVFSVNPSGQIWPWVRNGWTPPEERHYIDGLSPIVDAIAERLLFHRSMGGRFFINEAGAWIRPDSQAIQFLAFEFTD